MVSQDNKIWTVKDVLFWTSDYFSEKDISSPHLNAELLIAHVLECSRLDLYMKYDRPLAKKDLSQIKKLNQKKGLCIILSNIFLALQNFMESRFLLRKEYSFHALKPKFLVDANIAERKTAAEYLKQLESIEILQRRRIGREALYLNTKLYELLAQ